MKPTYVLRLEKEPPHRLRIVEDERLTYRTSLDSVESIEQVIVAIDNVFNDHPTHVTLLPAGEAPDEGEAADDEGWSEWSIHDDYFTFCHFCGDVCFMAGDEPQARFFYEQPLLVGPDGALEAKLLWLRGEIVEEPEEDNDEDVLPRYRKSADCRDLVARILLHRGAFRLNTDWFSGAALDFKKAIEIWPDCIADVRDAASAWADAGFPKQASVLEQVWKAHLSDTRDQG